MNMKLAETSLFTGQESTVALAEELFQLVAKKPILSPHGHVDARLLLENKPFANPSELFIYFDHYVTRLLQAEGYELTELGRAEPQNQDHKNAWRILCSNWHILAGTNSGYWLTTTFAQLFGITQTPSAENADELYELIDGALKSEEFLPRELMKKFNIEFLATTDDPVDDLLAHQLLAADESFSARVVATFRPDSYLDPRVANWKTNVENLLAVCEKKEINYRNYISALEERRAYFVQNGAVSADHGVYEPYTCELDDKQAETLFDLAIAEQISEEQSRDFAGHMLTEMARMSTVDGLVMTVHAGVLRNHSTEMHKTFGADIGADIPVAVEFTNNLRPLLNKYGHHKNLTLILFCLDENAWNREIAPLAGYYPAVRVGAPWWFFDAPDAALRFREKVTEISGFYRGSGFIDDTRAFMSIPARHEMARRVDSLFLAQLVEKGRITKAQAEQIAVDLVDAIPRRAFKL